jgi:hypothetical protein
MISMKVVNKWNRRLLRAVSRRVTGSSNSGGTEEGDDHSVGSNDDDVRITDNNGEVTRTLHRRTREQIMESMPPLGTLSQNSPQHMDLLYALAYPKRSVPEKEVPKQTKGGSSPVLSPPMEYVSEGDDDESKAEEGEETAAEFSRQPAAEEALTSGFNTMALDDKVDEGEAEDADEFKGSLATTNGDEGDSSPVEQVDSQA